MAFNNPTDRNRLIEYLQIPPDKNALSELDSKMSELETFDTTNSTSYVTRVQAALDALDALKTTIAAHTSVDTAIAISIPGEQSVTYAAGGKAKHDTDEWHEQIQAIKNILGYQTSYQARLVRS